MPERLRLDIDSKTYERLREIAISQRRPIGLQAEWMLIHAVAEYWSPGLRAEPPKEESVCLEGAGL